jgi:lantibiotic biosynthesis protein
MAKPTRPDVVAAAKFVLRTPLLARDELDRWGADLAVSTATPETLEAAIAADRDVLRARLREIVLRPEVREAIFVASPALDASIDAWLSAPTSEAGLRTERGLVRYISRMASRPTPFGLFAGNTVGAIGETTQLGLADRKTYGRYTRLDGDYLAHVTDMLGADPGIRAELRYRPNNSLGMVAGRLRYAMRTEGESRKYSLVSLEPSDYLVATLTAANQGALPGVLAQALVDADPEVSRQEADGFIDELIATQVLVSDLAPPVTGPEAIDDVVEQLLQLSSPLAVTTREVLARVSRDLRSLDANVGNPSAAYHAIAKSLEPLPVKLDIARLFQVNLVPKGVTLTLGKDVVDAMLRGVEMLSTMVPPKGVDDLSRFRDAFVDRYESREVSLTEVLDEESGIGYAASNAPGAQASPLLEGLSFPGSTADRILAWGAATEYLLRRVTETIARGHTELDLDDFDLKVMASETPAKLDAYSVLVDVARTATGSEILLNVASGPPPGAFLGRFCHSDPALHQVLRDTLAAEEALRPHAMFAEIVHLADGRLANISARPVLRDHEIVFLGRSGAPRDHQIEISDLVVSVRGDRVVLRSLRHGREVIPRLTNAHNFSMRSLGAYRFLASLQLQGRRPGGLPDEPLEALPYVPRIRRGNVLFRIAQWRLLGTELEPFLDPKKTAAERLTALQQLRTRRSLPRWICVEDGDNVLPVDLDNALSVDSFAHLLRGRPVATITELWPPPESLAVAGDGGKFANEVIVSFTAAERPQSAASNPGDRTSVRRRFPPGSEWLYAKLYTGNATADQVLEAIAPLTAELPQWFFIRYGDPNWHIRLRVHGDPKWLFEVVARQLATALQPLVDDERIYRIQFDTYERELERYGGAKGIALCERWFHVDSVAVLAILGLLAGDEGIDARWKLAVRGADQLLTDLGFDLATKLTLMRSMRDSFATEHRVDKSVLFQRQLGDRYRKDRKLLETMLDPVGDEESDFSPALVHFAERSRASAPIFEELRRAELPLLELAPSLVHMHANRILRSAGRAHETVIYDLLVRLYESRVARSKKK